MLCCTDTRQIQGRGALACFSGLSWLCFDKLACCDSAVLRAGKPSVVQLLNYKKNGNPFINYLSITPIHDVRGHVTHFVGIQSDISDLVNHKKAELAAKHEAAQVSITCCK